MAGPLSNLKIVEIVGLGASPFCAMVLADLGATVIRVDRRLASAGEKNTDPLARSRRSIALNLKTESGLQTLLRLVDQADAVFEGFRPGVAERLGFGPDICRKRNRKLVYGRLTGWGQQGPLAKNVGHDINYIALSGLLHSIGEPGGRPVQPLNVVGDFAGGGLLLALGIVAALLHAKNTGAGQVVETSMLDGAAAFLAMAAGDYARGSFDDAPGASVLGGAAPFYRTYETADGKFVAVGALEPRFLRCFVEILGLDEERWLAAGLSNELEVASTADWPELTRQLEQLFRSRSRQEWCDLFDGSDACVSPVLSLGEAPLHPHNQFRGTFTAVDAVVQAAPVPRFSDSELSAPTAPEAAGRGTREVLMDWGFSAEEIDGLCDDGGIPGII